MRWCGLVVLGCALLITFGCSTFSQMAVDESVDFKNELNVVVILGSSEGVVPINIIDQILGNVTTVFMNLNYQVENGADSSLSSTSFPSPMRIFLMKRQPKRLER